MQPFKKSSESLPRQRILRKRHHFDAAFESGKRFHNRYFTLLILPREEENPGEVAFLTPKRLGDAVIRNRLRRRLREAYRRHFPVDSTRRAIWLAKSPAIALDFAALVRAMKELHGSIPS